MNADKTLRSKVLVTNQLTTPAPPTYQKKESYNASTGATLLSSPYRSRPESVRHKIKNQLKWH